MAWGVHGGVCMAGSMSDRGHTWQGEYVWQGGVHGRHYEIRSMSGWYVSYWNAFLLWFAKKECFEN